MEDVYFELEISPKTDDPPLGFLFVCPEDDFRYGPSSFRWPECPAYWSVDSSGVERLSTKTAARLGFPSIQLCAKMNGRWWDASVYAGLRRFHRAKGFDPDSQDVARHLGYRLYHEGDSLFAHGESTFEAECLVSK